MPSSGHPWGKTCPKPYRRYGRKDGQSLFDWLGSEADITLWTESVAEFNEDQVAMDFDIESGHLYEALVGEGQAEQALAHLQKEIAATL
ncbi:hypothetical protein GLAREA_06615 [Glarea lozoyensis ATCC 20868]|uniref:Uncharacterized protein n=1 Tax=Glarea lozoyensis (strain ATCC 20868 / MF5171) TaxID=1116229 RepID=S3D562_GLAL2|nr:uncharacterized protein GLAREA_06615 [Glarea lozoyensis ATCC 20868]EPE33602.1 hypothetical protein GLAREA_06615 [Glarea lozoyensis ATCC 20868]